MPTLLFRLILLILAGVAVHSSVPAIEVAATVAPTGIDVAVVPPMPSIGETTELNVQLNRPGGASTVLILEITYANGATQREVASTIGSSATLVWEIPDDVIAGPATFQLEIRGCGCGEGGRQAASAPPERVEGVFHVGQ